LKTLVTGGAGFIGSHLVELLISQGHQVIVVDDLSTGRRENLFSPSSKTGVRLVVADIAKIESIRPWFEEVDWVFHLAGKADIVPSIEQPIDYFTTNVLGTLNVLECAR
jgi:UDP-glucose 4-epimerase